MSGRVKEAMDLLLEGYDGADVAAELEMSVGELDEMRGSGEWAERLRVARARAKVRGEEIITANVEMACRKLVGLMDSEKEQTARQACLDIINMPPLVEGGGAGQGAGAGRVISEKEAAGILEVLQDGAGQTE